MDNPWLELQPDRDEFLLAMDRAAVHHHNAKARPEHRFMLEMVPEPFLGRPGAPVVVLTGNPRYRPDDLPVHRAPEVRERLVRSLHGVVMRYPLVWLDPDLRHTTGAAWYLAKLRALVEATSLEAVAQGVVFYESLPYHSAELKHSKLGIPSQSFTNRLAAEALEDARVVVWQRAPWPRILDRDLAADPRVLRVRSPQNSHLTARNLGGMHIFDLVVNALSK